MPRVTLVGKGVCFDTGGLDIKPPSNMMTMKKDMGGAAAVLSLASMIMEAKLPVRLRVGGATKSINVVVRESTKAQRPWRGSSAQ